MRCNRLFQYGSIFALLVLAVSPNFESEGQAMQGADACPGPACPGGPSGSYPSTGRSSPGSHAPNTGNTSAQTMGVILNTMRQLQNLYSDDEEANQRLQAQQRERELQATREANRISQENYAARQREAASLWQQSEKIGGQQVVGGGQASNSSQSSAAPSCQAPSSTYRGIVDNRKANCQNINGKRAETGQSPSGAKTCLYLGAYAFGLGIHASDTDAACRWATNQNQAGTASSYKNGQFYNYNGEPMRVQKGVCENGGWFAIAYAGYPSEYIPGRLQDVSGGGGVCGKPSREIATQMALDECRKSNPAPKICHLYVTGLNEGKTCNGIVLDDKGPNPNSTVSLRIMGSYAQVTNDDGSVQECVP